MSERYGGTVVVGIAVVLVMGKWCVDEAATSCFEGTKKKTGCCWCCCCCCCTYRILAGGVMEGFPMVEVKH